MELNVKIAIAGYGYVGRAHAEVLSNHYNILLSDPALGHTDNIQDADALIVAVSTPESSDGSCFYGNVLSVIKNSPNIPILVKSTISLEGWQAIKDECPNAQVTFSPEYLRAATAFEDFKKSKYFWLGGGDCNAWVKILGQAFENCDFLVYPAEELILAKYFTNSFLATKVSFFNQIYDLCESLNLDYGTVARCVASDPRIGDSHIAVTKERGFGGHCFPKDTQAISMTAKHANVNLSLINESILYNKTIRKD
jgi:UDPglucose 6-dehydrogenase